MNDTVPATSVFITPDALLAHWHGHRRVTRRLIEAYPQDQLFTFSIGGMRTFGELVLEILGMGAPMLRGAVSNEWDSYEAAQASSRVDLLRLWDANTAEIDRLWPKLPPARFHERLTAFGVYEGPLHDLLLYVIDNEIHHRGQAYVYMRALGQEPPAFWDRS